MWLGRSLAMIGLLCAVSCEAAILTISDSKLLVRAVGAGSPLQDYFGIQFSAEHFPIIEYTATINDSSYYIQSFGKTYPVTDFMVKIDGKTVISSTDADLFGPRSNIIGYPNVGVFNIILQRYGYIFPQFDTQSSLQFEVQYIFPAGIIAGDILPTSASFLNSATSAVFSFGASNIATGSFFGLSSDSTVPEPATWAMMVIGFGLIGMNIRSRISKGLA